MQREYLTRGGIYFADLFSDGPVQKYQVVEVRDGTRSQDASLLNALTIAP